jgi:hypothetical protein
MSSITIYLTNSSGVPLSGQTVKLRRAGLDNFGTDYLTMVDVAGKPGKYKTVDAYVSDRYKVWVNGAEDESFGGPDGLEITLQSDILLKSGGTMSGVINMNGQKITGLTTPTENTDATPKAWVDNEKLAKSGGTVYGDLNMDGHKVKSLAEATEAGDAVSKQFLEQKLTDEGYVKETSNNTLQGNNIFSGNNVFTVANSFSTVPPLFAQDPSNDNHGTRRSWVIRMIAEMSAAYQESVNVIRLLPGGTVQANKAYIDWAAASSAARTLVNGGLRRMTVKIEGQGIQGNNILPTDGGIDGNLVFNTYVNYVGLHQDIVIEFSGTATMSHLYGIVANLMFYCNDADAEITFDGFTFKDMYFKFLDSTAVYFINCNLRNSFIKVLNGVCTFTSCKGGGNISNVDIGRLGDGGIDPNDF